ncbi:hypothetical protein CHCC20441_2250 [Bacillus licheniformis]|uniref:Uncharacterized protein n=1 Tax=Bacillus licheniformis TaxID=1402 RepID=A0A8B5YFY3_BACLI|nr:hypothetical protein LI17339_08265 [Bacillus licheniformis LMG 17339]KYC73455.1 hypothetical protein B4092_3756 [Bacillus licheniformis]KYC84482.1 hypothetical protein B4091_3812 [Bacillus licheniformis]KYC98426.1 hypothetical protein B4164_3462 [Bacillus licheniformis]OLF91475.1 hypothetical protein B4089_2414 [Bacillus licheniformis]
MGLGRFELNKKSACSALFFQTSVFLFSTDFLSIKRKKSAVQQPRGTASWADYLH